MFYDIQTLLFSTFLELSNSLKVVIHFTDFQNMFNLVFDRYHKKVVLESHVYDVPSVQFSSVAKSCPTL